MKNQHLWVLRRLRLADTTPGMDYLSSTFIIDAVQDLVSSGHVRAHGGARSRYSLTDKGRAYLTKLRLRGEA